MRIAMEIVDRNAFDSETWEGDYPMVLRIGMRGDLFVAVGRGMYPYDCIAKDKQPNAMIYRSDCAWTMLDNGRD